MSELTLEALAARVEKLEQKLAGLTQPPRDWQSVVGMFEGSDFMRQVDEEVQAAREADRAAGRGEQQA